MARWKLSTSSGLESGPQKSPNPAGAGFAGPCVSTGKLRRKNLVPGQSSQLREIYIEPRPLKKEDRVGRDQVPRRCDAMSGWRFTAEHFVRKFVELAE